MADSGGSAAPSIGLVTLFIPRPSLKPVTFWQGIVEIAARGVLLVILLILLAVSSAAEDDVEDIGGSSDVERHYRNAQAAAGFAIFMGVVTLIYEIVFIVCRFLNFGFMVTYRTIVLIVDIIFHGVCALLLFASAVSMAYYSDYSKDLADLDINRGVAGLLNKIGDNLGAASAFAFFSLFGMIFIAVWMVLYLVFKWDIGGKSGSSSSTGVV